MKSKFPALAAACAAVLCAVLPALAAAASPSEASGASDAPLRLLGRTDLAGYEGDFDHLAADVPGNRLFVAGEDGGTLEVFDLLSGAHVKTVSGLESPHAIHYVRGTEKLIVTDSGRGMTRILDARSYAVTGTIPLTPGADVMSADPSTGRLWIVAGGKNAEHRMPYTVLNEVDAQSGKLLGKIPLDSDFTEGVAAEQKGRRLFVNVAGRSTIAVIDKKSRHVLTTWPVTEGKNNAPIALDEAHHRLFVVTRDPFKLVIFDTEAGKSVASFDVPQRTNDLALDAENGRLYATGDDYVAVFQRDAAGAYRELARVPSEKGAKTAIYVPEVHRLYVAVAGKAPGRAGLLSVRGRAQQRSHNRLTNQEDFR